MASSSSDTTARSSSIHCPRCRVSLTAPGCLPLGIKWNCENCHARNIVTCTSDLQVTVCHTNDQADTEYFANRTTEKLWQSLLARPDVPAPVKAMLRSLPSETRNQTVRDLISQNDETLKLAEWQGMMDITLSCNRCGKRFPCTVAQLPETRIWVWCGTSHACTKGAMGMTVQIEDKNGGSMMVMACSLK